MTDEREELAEELRVDFARFARMFREYDLTDEADIQSVREVLVDLALDAHGLLVEVRRGEAATHTN